MCLYNQYLGLHSSVFRTTVQLSSSPVSDIMLRLRRLPIIDIVHRSLVGGLVCLGVGGIALGVQVHRDTLRRGEGE